MTEFQLKRLQYFIKAATKGEYVQLGPGDIEILQDIEHQQPFIEGYDKGWEEGIEYVVSGQMAFDEMQEDARKSYER